MLSLSRVPNIAHTAGLLGLKDSGPPLMPTAAKPTVSTPMTIQQIVRNQVCRLGFAGVSSPMPTVAPATASL
jgi:hypothetical protein